MQINKSHIQPYDPSKDANDVADLWQTALGQTWPLSSSRIQRVLSGPEAQHFVLREDGRLIGFVATFKGYQEQQPVGYLAALLVAPQWQGRGIGTMLHDVALEHLRAVGVDAIHLGRHSPRFWNGVPTNLPEARTFFQRRGWQWSETVYDLVQNLTTFIMPERVSRRMAEERVTFAVATRETVDDLLAFEAREFPHWLPGYELCARLGDYQDLFAARDAKGDVIGTLIMYSPQSHPARTDLIWQGLLGEDAGAIGSVGVAEAERGRGVGLALVAYGSALLRERRVGNCYIDWVVLTDFYAKLGYQIWREYAMSQAML